ncbi:hypothetical protein WT58_27940 [Burkholderia territorii]|nr:hypothetical protein WT58_27940 [Burkholderia territorii]KWH06629.1 hypothetical protein WT59_02090 [Burkholderia territorii]
MLRKKPLRRFAFRRRETGIGLGIQALAQRPLSATRRFRWLAGASGRRGRVRSGVVIATFGSGVTAAARA